MSHDFAFGPFVLDTQRAMLLRDGRPVTVSSKGLQLGTVAELVGIEVGVVSGVINLESSGVEAVGLETTP